MTINQLFFAIAGLLAAAVGYLKYYIDAKIDPVSREMRLLIDPVATEVRVLVQYMVSHEGRISTVEERTRK